MDQLSFTDGFTALFLVQSIIVGILLILDVTVQNRILGIFVILYAANSSRIVLYKLAGQSPLVNFLVGISLAGFFMPCLYFFLKSHIEVIGKKMVIKHSIIPSLLMIFSIGYTSDLGLNRICSNDQYNMISYSTLSLLCMFYGYLSLQIIQKNLIWKEILPSVRTKISIFTLGLIGYLLYISVRILLSLIFDLSSSPDDPFYLIQTFIFYLVFAIIPFYAYTVLSRFKKFIQPRSVSTAKTIPTKDLKLQLEHLFQVEKIHTAPDLNPNSLASILDVPIKDLRVYFKNHFRKSIPDFITEKRLEEFIALSIGDTKNIYNIEGIALNAGFKSRPTFYRAFKSKFGVTPMEHLESIK